MAPQKSKSKIKASNRRGARADAYARIIEVVEHETENMGREDERALLGELVAELEDRIGPKGSPQ